MKKVIALALAVLLALTLAPTGTLAATPGKDAADRLHTLGLFQGVGTNADGTPNYALDSAPTRAQAVTMLVRLLGKESEAMAGTWTTPFTDVDDWAKPYVGYAYVNKLTNGVSATSFGSAANVTAAQYITFVLRALGYADGTDFTWSSAWTLSDKLGFTSGEYGALYGAEYGMSFEFTRGNVASVSYDALFALGKATGKPLYETLLAAGVFTSDAANAAGLVAKSTSKWTVRVYDDDALKEYSYPYSNSNGTDYDYFWIVVYETAGSAVRYTGSLNCASSNPSAATVTVNSSGDGDGFYRVLVTPRGVGAATITLSTPDGASGSFKVAVKSNGEADPDDNDPNGTGDPSQQGTGGTGSTDGTTMQPVFNTKPLSTVTYSMAAGTSFKARQEFTNTRDVTSIEWKSSNPAILRLGTPVTAHHVTNSAAYYEDLHYYSTSDCELTALGRGSSTVTITVALKNGQTVSEAYNITVFDGGGAAYALKAYRGNSVTGTNMPLPYTYALNQSSPLIKAYVSNASIRWVSFKTTGSYNYTNTRQDPEGLSYLSDGAGGRTLKVTATYEVSVTASLDMAGFPTPFDELPSSMLPLQLRIILGSTVSSGNEWRYFTLSEQPQTFTYQIEVEQLKSTQIPAVPITFYSN